MCHATADEYDTPATALCHPWNERVGKTGDGIDVNAPHHLARIRIEPAQRSNAQYTGSMDEGVDVTERACRRCGLNAVGEIDGQWMKALGRQRRGRTIESVNDTTQCDEARRDRATNACAAAGDGDLEPGDRIG